MMSATEEIYGASTHIGNNLPDNLSSAIAGSSKNTSSKMAYNFNEPSIDSYSSSHAIPVSTGGRNRESGTMATNERKKNNQWTGEEGIKDIEDEDTKVANPFPIGGSDNIHASNEPVEGSKRPQTSHGRDRRAVRDGVRRREEKTVGLGETSKNVWQLDNDEDAQVVVPQND